MQVVSFRMLLLVDGKGNAPSSHRATVVPFHVQDNHVVWYTTNVRTTNMGRISESSFLNWLVWAQTSQVIAFSFTRIPLSNLVSSCVTAAQLGCQEIRKVAETSFSVEYKDPTDPKSAFTLADERAQLAIVQYLTAEYGGVLHIVGEEDEEELGTLLEDSSELRANNRDLSERLNEACTDIINLEDITIYVDPLDGSREFVEGRLQNCQCLVGIAHQNQPLAGIAALPFATFDPDNTSAADSIGHFHVGIPGQNPFYGCFKYNDDRWQPVDHPKARRASPTPLLATGDATHPVMIACRELFQSQFGGEWRLYGGAGNKLLTTALGKVNCTIQHKFGGPWDVCAPAAIVQALGGIITDMNGDALSLTDTVANKRGFVATNSLHEHKRILQTMKAEPQVQLYLDKAS